MPEQPTTGGQQIEDQKQTVGCPVCVSFAHGTDAEQIAKSHNESRHGGEEIARVIQPHSEDCVNEFVDTAREETPPQQFQELLRRIVRGNSPYTVGTVVDS